MRLGGRLHLVDDAKSNERLPLRELRAPLSPNTRFSGSGLVRIARKRVRPQALGRGDPLGSPVAAFLFNRLFLAIFIHPRLYPSGSRIPARQFVNDFGT